MVLNFKTFLNSQLNQGLSEKKRNSTNISQCFETNLCAKCKYIDPDFLGKNKQIKELTYL